MNKPSDMFDLFDKSAKCYNFFIDMNNQRISQEINWLYDNYRNIYALRAYFLRFVDPRCFASYIKYMNYLKSLSDAEIQLAAQNRANVLYSCMKNNEQCKIESKPLEVIAEELKRHNQ